jgi:nucleotide-binding universal stress UspA family protein
MPLIQHILAATDLSGFARHAVDRGFALAATTGARLSVMHVLGFEGGSWLRGLLGAQADEVTERVCIRQREALVALADEAARRHGVQADEVLVEPGLPAIVVPERATSLGVDLAVVGARGEGTLRRLVIGSTTTRLLRQSHCPVLVVRNPCRHGYRRVLVPVDFSPGSALAVRLAREVAPDADLVLLHVFTTPFEGVLRSAGIAAEVIEQHRAEAQERALQQLRALADAHGLGADDCTVLAMPGDIVSVIVGEQERLRCDLIAMGKHGAGVTAELFLGSVTQRVLTECDADVLVAVDKASRS